MADLLRPGERLFWVYFVVAVPMIGLVVLGYIPPEVILPYHTLTTFFLSFFYKLLYVFIFAIVTPSII